jgi:glycine/D-amino acid oxidase-like deaminating enzyme
MIAGMYHPGTDLAAPPLAYARLAPPAPVTRRLEASHHTAVAVVGAGFIGLSAALHLAEAGVAVTVLETRSIGWGASGRAFGQVVPYLKHDHDRIARHYGRERGPRIIDAIAAGPDLVARLIERLGIACDLRRSGLIFAAHTPSGERVLGARAAYWQRLGASVEMLDGAAATAAIGSTVYRTALLDHRGVHLNPLAYARGLAYAAARTGARIHEGMPVRSLTPRGDRWRIAAGAHEVSADAVILATNAYSDALWPGLADSIVPLRGHGAVSAPLSENLRRSIFRAGGR